METMERDVREVNKGTKQVTSVWGQVVKRGGGRDHIVRCKPGA